MSTEQSVWLLGQSLAQGAEELCRQSNLYGYYGTAWLRELKSCVGRAISLATLALPAYNLFHETLRPSSRMSVFAVYHWVVKLGSCLWRSYVTEGEH